MPAFGAGCSSTIFNTDRTRVLVALRTKTLKESNMTKAEEDELRRLEIVSAAGDEVAEKVEIALARQLLERRLPALDDFRALDEVTARLLAEAPWGCVSCRGTAVHEPDCPRYGEPLPPDPLPLPAPDGER